ncbi:MAG: MFS transporter [Chloroflexota bacterium]|nr:MFS transporter [Chloroflexota bacterium]
MQRQLLTGMNAFYALVTGQFISMMGSAITRFGISVWVFNETGSTSAYTLLLFFSIFPIGIGALIAGPLVDRWSRRRVMMVSDVIAGLSTLVIAILFFLNALELWTLYAALFVNGVASAFSRPALDASIPLLVPTDKLTRAAGLSQMSGAVEMILSSALAGFVVGVFGLGVVFVIDFVTFGINILIIMFTAIPQPQRSAARQVAHNVWQDFVVGLSYVRQRPSLMYLLGLFSITMFLLPGVAYSLVTPLVLTFANEQSLGLILSGFGVGSLLGGMFMAAWGKSRRRMQGIFAGMAVAGLAAILISLRESTFLIGIGFLITGISFVFIMGLSRVIWQMKAAPDVLGRVFSLQLALGVGAQSLGALLAGVLADRVFEPLFIGDGALVNTVGVLLGTGTGRGMAFMFLLVGVIQIVVVLVSVAMPSVRQLEDRLPDAETVHLPLDTAPQAIRS